MIYLECKNCGGHLVPTEGTIYGKCEFCQSEAILPQTEKLVKMLNRADSLRRTNEFDRALNAYENIIMEYPSEVEALWGAVLCRYGIEYVEENGKHIPTCHRLQFESILQDTDYLELLKCAGESRGRYAAEAENIDRVMKDVLAVSSKEEPYDIFICYKETDNSGRRTEDSELAIDIYYNLVNEGYSVFFSRVSLKDIPGRSYEPYIFGALNSAKVMLVIGTKNEHFQSVWVKNEWSRFLALMKKDPSRLLIPCYRGMTAYDLPAELSHLQGFDMSKIGFLQDLFRGINKTIAKNNAESLTSQSITEEIRVRNELREAAKKDAQARDEAIRKEKLKLEEKAARKKKIGWGIIGVLVVGYNIVLWLTKIFHNIWFSTYFEGSPRGTLPNWGLITMFLSSGLTLTVLYLVIVIIGAVLFAATDFEDVTVVWLVMSIVQIVAVIMHDMKLPEPSGGYSIGTAVVIGIAMGIIYLIVNVPVLVIENKIGEKKKSNDIMNRRRI